MSVKLGSKSVCDGKSALDLMAKSLGKRELITKEEVEAMIQVKTALITKQMRELEKQVSILRDHEQIGKSLSKISNSLEQIIKNVVNKKKWWHFRWVFTNEDKK